MKDLPNQKGCFDGVVGISHGTPARSGFHWVPLVDRFLGKPDRDVATPTQGLVVFRPVGHLVFGLGELVAAFLVMFVRHEVSSKIQLPRIMPVRQDGGQFLIYSTTPHTSLILYVLPKAFLVLSWQAFRSALPYAPWPSLGDVGRLLPFLPMHFYLPFSFCWALELSLGTFIAAFTRLQFLGWFVFRSYSTR